VHDDDNDNYYYYYYYYSFFFALGEKIPMAKNEAKIKSWSG